MELSFRVMSKNSYSNLMSKIFPILTSNFFYSFMFYLLWSMLSWFMQKKDMRFRSKCFFSLFLFHCFLLPVNAQLFLLFNILSLHCWVSFAYCICKYSLYIRILIISYTDWVLKISWLYLCAAIYRFSVLFFWSMCLSLHRYHTILITIAM